VIVGVAGIPDAWSTERLAASLRDEGIDSFVLSLADVVHDLGTGAVRHGERDLRAVDGIAVKKLGSQADATTRLRLHALRELEGAGVRVFSPVDVIDRAMDRYRMTMMLVEAGIPVPETRAVASETGLRAAVAELGDCVVKPIYTSKGRGMVRVTDGNLDGCDLGQETGGHEWLVQRFVDAPGRDIGATVVGGRFVGAFYRVAAEGDWMTTTARGGRYAPCELSAVGIELAERAAQSCGLDYTVVDLVEQGDGFLAYEVSAFGGFRGLFEASGIDASQAYARHIRAELAGA
jgi:ribosomal protein S6--L-glutamate ligase